MKGSPPRVAALPANYLADLGRKIDELARGGLEVIRMDVGSPDMPPPPHVIEALQLSAARSDSHGYQSHRGTAGLREAWARAYSRCFGVDLDPGREVLPLLGSKEGIFHLTQAVVGPGDVVLVPDPGYLTYTHSTRFADGEPHFMPLLPERGYLPDLSAIPGQVARRARLLWLNYPHNPTGAVATRSFFERAVGFAREHDLLLCHDAAYSRVTYGEAGTVSVLQVPGAREVAVEFNTLSKSHNMAGWRVGVALGNARALEALYRLKTHADSGQFLPLMQAAVAALGTEEAWLQARNAVYQRRSERVARLLERLGAAFEPPRGGLYVWFGCPCGWTSRGLAQALLEEAGVSLAPGSLFGPRGEGYMRLSLCVPDERLDHALRRMERWWRRAVEG